MSCETMWQKRCHTLGLRDMRFVRLEQLISPSAYGLGWYELLLPDKSHVTHPIIWQLIIWMVSHCHVIHIIYVIFHPPCCHIYSPMRGILSWLHCIMMQFKTHFTTRALIGHDILLEKSVVIMGYDAGCNASYQLQICVMTHLAVSKCPRNHVQDCIPLRAM